MTARKAPTLKEKLAAFVLTMKVEDNGQLVPLVTRDEAKNMTTDQLLSLLNFDHDPIPVATAVALGMTAEEYNHPTNLTPLPIRTHRIKTATKDVPAIAKSNRISAEHQDFRRRVLAKVTGEEVEEAAKQKTTFRKKPKDTKYDWRTKRYVRVERRG